MKLTDLLLFLGKELGIEKLGLDDDGLCRLQVREQWIINIAPGLQEGLIYIFTEIATLSDEDAEEMKQLLCANLFGRDTSGASFALDESSHTVILQRDLWEEQTSPQEFRAAIQDLLEETISWEERLADKRGQKATEAPHSGLQQEHWKKI